MTESQNIHSDSLVLYIDYEDYLNPSQLSELFSTLDKMYNSLLVAYYPEANYPIPQESQLRIKETRTGNSILVELIQGVMQVWEMGDPNLTITGITGVTAAMSHIIIKFSKGFADTRKTWHEGTKAKYEAEQIKQETERANLEFEELQAKEAAERSSLENREISQLPKETQRELSMATFELLHSLEYASNIRAVRVNGTEVINKIDDSTY